MLGWGGGGGLGSVLQAQGGLIRKLMFQQRAEGDVEEHLLTEGTAGAKAPRLECAWHISATAKRAVSKRNAVGLEARGLKEAPMAGTLRGLWLSL